MKSTFTKTNYLILICGTIIIVLGYLLMIGGGSEDPNVFDPEIFSTRRIIVAPAVCLVGFVVVAVSIMWRPGEDHAIGNKKKKKKT